VEGPIAQQCVFVTEAAKCLMYRPQPKNSANPRTRAAMIMTITTCLQNLYLE